MKFEKINVVGLGYIGLPTAAVFAKYGVKVHGVDVNQDAIDTINRGEIHIIEPDLDAVVNEVVNSGFLKASTKAESADAYLIAVPTPFKGDHEPDLSYIQSAANTIAPALKKGDLVILESTSPVGATEQMAVWLAKQRPDLTFPQQQSEMSDIRIAHCPERVLPGKVLEELISNDRIIGGMTPKCSEMAVKLYKTFVKGHCVVTNARTAEMCKLTENSFRDVNIAFANELSIICDKLDINVWELIELANRHPRVDILQPGPGVGGHCIAVDPWFIVSKTPNDAKLIHDARKINDNKPNWVISQIEKAVTDKSEPINCLGIAFKPDIDDLRESPSLGIVVELLNKGYRVNVVEPNVEKLPEELLRLGAQKISLTESLSNSKSVNVLLVNHGEFSIMKEKGNDFRVLDFCGTLAE